MELITISPLVNTSGNIRVVTGLYMMFPRLAFIMSAGERLIRRMTYVVVTVFIAVECNVVVVTMEMGVL